MVIFVYLFICLWVRLFVRVLTGTRLSRSLQIGLMEDILMADRSAELANFRCHG